MPSLFEKLYRWLPRTPITDTELNVRFESVDGRLVPLEAIVISWEQALAVVEDRVLQRSEDVIAGLRNRLVEITQLAWLTGRSGTSVVLATDTDVSLIIDEANRPLFTPGPFAVISRTSDPYAYAVVRTAGYDRTRGQWDIRVVAAAGDLATAYTDWSIAAVAGSSLSQMVWLAEGKTARDATLAARDLAKIYAERTAADVLSTGLNRSGAEAAAAIANTKAGEATASAAAAATFDPSTYATKASLTAQISAVKGNADAAHDSLSELAALTDANTAAAAANAIAIAANATAVAEAKRLASLAIALGG
nr:hypothetical protein NG677_17485 [Methylobacterium sp. OTU13CASTA1]